MHYITVQEAASNWGISDRRVRLLCQQGKIEGVTREGHRYRIPDNAPKPADARTTRHLTIPEQYAAIFSRIDSKKQILSRRRPLTEAELHRLQEEFMVEYTYDSNAIEGNTLTLQETALVLEGITIDQRPLKEHLEAVGHRDAFLYVQQLVSDNVPLSEKVAREIHSLVLMDRAQDRGVYRRIPVRIMGAAYQPPQPYLVPVQMEMLLNDYKECMSRMHPVERVAIFHLRFEGIHPFIDGNGRTGRLLMNLDLMRHGYPPVNIKFADRMKYYRCFEVYHDESNADEMVMLLAGYMEMELDRYLEILA